MFVLFDSKIRFVFLAGVAATALGCSAEASSPDAAGTGAPDARVQTPRPDGAPFVPADAAPPADAMPTCPDPNEANDTLATATSLSATPVGDANGDGGSFTGAAFGADLDWFTYEGSDKLGAIVDPTVGVTSGAVEVCMFMACLEGPIQYSCPTGTTDLNDSGVGGCCNTTGFTVTGLNCDGLSDDANIYIRVKPSAVDVCESYSMTYHY